MDKEVLFRDDSLHEDVLFKCIEESESENEFSENSEKNSSLDLTNENMINSAIEEEHKAPKIVIRKYQNQIYHLAKNRNGIAVLETGTGKTVIAISLIAYHLNKFLLEKKIVFLTETVQLCEQQYRQVREKIKPLMENIFFAEGQNIDPDKIIFEILHGERDAEISGTRKYKEIIEHSHVFVMTSQVFLNCLRKGYLSILEFSLLVFDECHHANLGHPYNNIMREFYFYFKNDKDNKKPLPQILGLTASPLLSLSKNNVCEKSNLENLEENLSLLCQNLDSNYLDYEEKEEDIRIFVKEAKVVILVFENDIFLQNFGVSFLKYIESFNAAFGQFKDFIFPIPAFAHFYSIFKEIYEKDLHLNSAKTKALFLKIDSYLRVRSLRILYELGFAAFSYFITDLVEGMNELIGFFEGTKYDLDREKFFRVKKLFSDLSKVLTKRFENEVPGQSYSIKLDHLISLIKKKTENSLDTTILIFVSKRILARYLSVILCKIFKADFVIGRKKACEGQKVNEVIESLETQPDDGMLSNQVDQQISLFEKLNQQKEKQNDFFANKFKHVLKDKFSLKEQLKAIDNFKKKQIDILICTSVTEEGFDVSMCNLVVAFNEVVTIKSFIQLKGRARKENSEFILMGPELMEEKLHETKRTYEILLKAMKIQISRLSKLTNSQILERKISMKSKNDQNRFYDCVLLKESGALLNSNWSKELVANYCSYFKKAGLKIDKCIEFFLKVDNKGYKCVVILPPSARKRIFFHSDFFLSTDEAKKATYFEAAKKLLEYGCFTKHLKANNTNIFESDFDSEGPSLQEIDPKNVKRVQKSKNGKIQSSLVYYRKHNEIWDLALYKKEFNLIHLTSYLYSIQIYLEGGEKLKSEVKLGFVYFTDWLDDFRAEFKFEGKNAFLRFKLIKKIDIPEEALHEAIFMSYFLEASFWKDFLLSQFEKNKLINVGTDKACFVPLKKKKEIDFERIRNFINFLREKPPKKLDIGCQDSLNKHNSHLALINENNRIFILEKSQNNLIIRDISEKLGIEKIENLESEARIPNFDQDKLYSLHFPYEFLLKFQLVLKSIQKLKEHISSILFKERLVQKEKNYNKKSFPMKILNFDFSFFKKEFPEIMKKREFESFLKQQTSSLPFLDEISKDLSQLSYIKPIEKVNLTAINSLTLTLDKPYNDSEFLQNLEIETLTKLLHFDDSIKTFYGGIGNTLINFLVRLKLFQEFFEADYSRLYAELKRVINDRYKGSKVCQHYLYEYIFNNKSNRNFFLFDYKRSNGEWKTRAKYEKINNRDMSLILDQLIGSIYLECEDDVFACDKFLSMINYYDGPCLESIRFLFSHKSDNLKDYWKHLEQIELPFKNKYLLLNALIHSSFVNTIYNFYKNEEFSDILSRIDFLSSKKQDKISKNFHESSLSLLEYFSNKFNNLDTSSLHNERLLFLGEGYLDYLIQKILLKIFNKEPDKFLLGKKVFTSRCFYLYVCLRFKLDESLLCSPGIIFNCKNFKDRLDYFSKNFNEFIDQVFFKMSKTPDYSMLSDLFPAVAAAFLIDSDLNLKEADETITDYFQLETLIKTILLKLNFKGTPWNKYQKFLKDYKLKEPHFKCKLDYELKDKGQYIYKFQFIKKKAQVKDEKNCIEIQADTEENAQEDLIRQLCAE